MIFFQDGNGFLNGECIYIMYNIHFTMFLLQRESIISSSGDDDHIDDDSAPKHLMTIYIAQTKQY